MKLPVFLTFLFASFTTFSQSDFYELSVSGLTNDSIRFSEFRGKLVLIVNTATDSSIDQLSHLEKLQASYYDSGLVVVAIPSNNYGHEKSNRDAVRDKYSQYHFIVSDVQNVSGPDQCALYRWLTSRDLNGVTDNPIDGDYKKFMVNREGRLVAAFHETSTVNNVFFMMSLNANK